MMVKGNSTNSRRLSVTMLGRGAVDAARGAAVWLTSSSQQPETVGALIRRHLGTDPRIYRGPGKGALVPIRGLFHVGVRGDLSPQQAAFTAAHELAHWYWEVHVGYRGSELEARCDALAAALVAPDWAVEAAASELGLDVVALADRLDTTQSVALLRLGEVCNVPVALLRRRKSTIIRGPFVSWPVPLSWQPAKRSPGLVKVEIDDEPARFGVVG